MNKGTGKHTEENTKTELNEVQKKHLQASIKYILIYECPLDVFNI